MLILACNIKITHNAKVIKFDYVTSVEVVSSMKNFTDTAKVVLPRRLKFQDVNITEYIKRGDAIEIKLGYTEYDVTTVFQGYIKSVATGFPLTIECEDNAWLLKQKTVKDLYYEKFNLSGFIKEHIPQIECATIDDVSLGEIRINGEVTIAEVFEYLMKNYPVNFFFRNGKLYGILNATSMMQDGVGKTVNFTYGKNVINADDLKYTKAEDLKIAVVAKHINRQNKKLEVKVPANAGQDYEVRTFHCDDAKDENALKSYAEQRLKEYKVDKMEGNFTAFGVPFTEIGDTVKFKDKLYEERNNKTFVVDSVTYSFGQNGYRQKISIGSEIKTGGTSKLVMS